MGKQTRIELSLMVMKEIVEGTSDPHGAASIHGLIRPPLEHGSASLDMEHGEAARNSALTVEIEHGRKPPKTEHAEAALDSSQAVECEHGCAEIESEHGRSVPIEHGRCGVYAELSQPQMVKRVELERGPNGELVIILHE